MRTLDAGEINEAGRAADQRAARKDEFRHRLPPAGADRPRAIGDALAAEECINDQRMSFETLELIERRKGRVRVVEVNHEANSDEIVVIVIEERAAAGAAAEWPAEGMLDQAWLVFRRIDLPDFLEADAEFLRLAPLLELEALDQMLGGRTA